jgi:hypothetical protein
MTIISSKHYGGIESTEAARAINSNDFSYGMVALETYEEKQ